MVDMDIDLFRLPIIGETEKRLLPSEEGTNFISDVYLHTSNFYNHKSNKLW